MVVHYQGFLDVKSQQHKYFNSFIPDSSMIFYYKSGSGENAAHETTRQHIRPLKECKVHVLEIGSVGQTVY